MWFIMGGEGRSFRAMPSSLVLKYLTENLRNFWIPTWSPRVSINIEIPCGVPRLIERWNWRKAKNREHSHFESVRVIWGVITSLPMNCTYSMSKYQLIFRIFMILIVMLEIFKLSFQIYPFYGTITSTSNCEKLMTYCTMYTFVIKPGFLWWSIGELQ